MLDNRLKPVFHPKRLNTKKGNFQNTSSFGTVMTGGLELYKEQIDSLNTLFNTNNGNLFWQKYDLKKSFSERKSFSVEEIPKALYIKHLIKLVL